MSGPPFDYNELSSSAEKVDEDVRAAPPDDVLTMSFEAALAELEGIVKDLEQGELDLDAAIGAYERGTALRRHCETKLREARLRVERITLGGEGQVGSEPMDVG